MIVRPQPGLRRTKNQTHVASMQKQKRRSKNTTKPVQDMPKSQSL